MKTMKTWTPRTSRWSDRGISGAPLPSCSWWNRRDRGSWGKANSLPLVTPEVGHDHRLLRPPRTQRRLRLPLGAWSVETGVGAVRPPYHRSLQGWLPRFSFPAYEGLSRASVLPRPKNDDNDRGTSLGCRLSTSDILLFASGVGGHLRLRTRLVGSKNNLNPASPRPLV
jgi:hypothetical protein